MCVVLVFCAEPSVKSEAAIQRTLGTRVFYLGCNDPLYSFGASMEKQYRKRHLHMMAIIIKKQVQ